jgi:phage shock protein PspC (stress-responsive transcriptional regulator)
MDVSLGAILTVLLPVAGILVAIYLVVALIRRRQPLGSSLRETSAILTR